MTRNHLRPDSFDQFLFRHQPASVADEMEQDGKLFRRESDGPALTPQTLVDLVQAEGSEDDVLI